MAEQVRIVEVAPRDGLQNESRVVPTATKLAFIERLVAAGFKDIEASSFVGARWIPQLADAEELFPRLPQVDGVTYWALVPNRRGLERAHESGVRAVATFLSASESHNLKNVNRTTRESLMGLREVIADARAEGMRVRSYISTVFGCPYEGEVDPARSVELAAELLALGAEQVSLGDTTGMGHPEKVRAVLNAMAAAKVPVEKLALHLHDTRGTALANALTGLQLGIRTFDASIAGLGGCPYAPGASGNAATEDLVYLLHGMGYQTGIDLEKAAAAGHFIEAELGRELPGRFHLFHRGNQGGKVRAQNG